MPSRKPIEEIDQFKTYGRARMEYESISGANRFFSYFVPNSWTRAGTLRNEMGLLNQYLRVEAVDEKEKEDAYAKYVKEEEEKRRNSRQYEFEKGLSDDTYSRVNRFLGSSNFDYQTAQDRYDTLRECYDEIPLTERLLSRILPDSWTQAGRIRRGRDMAMSMLERQINGDHLFQPVPGQNLSKNETLMHNYLKTYRGYAKEYSKLSGFQKFIGSILPNNWTEYGRLKTDMEVNDMMLLRETNQLTPDDLQQIRDLEYDKMQNPDKYKVTPEVQKAEEETVDAVLEEALKRLEEEAAKEERLGKEKKEKSADKDNIQKDPNEKEKVNENQVNDKENDKEKDNLEKSNVNLNEIKKDPNNKEVTNNNNNILNQEQLKENKDLDKSQNELNNNEILKDDKKDENNKSDLDLNKDNQGPEKKDNGVIKNIKNEDESLDYGKLDIDLSDNHLDPLDLDEMNGKFHDFDKQINNDDKKPEEIGENNNEQHKNGVNQEKTIDLQNMLGRDTGANIPNSSNENYQKNLEEMSLNDVIQNEHYSDMKN